MKLISAYIKIIQMEYDEKIKINLKIKGDILKYSLPAGIIEPVIENSILHGIYPKASGGEVSIEIEASVGKINISIKDTGIGIDSEMVENIFKNNNRSLGKIYRRLKYIYKNNFKMEIISRIEDGTIVLFELPQTRLYLFKNAAG
jgi:two-component system LytT family sensor kinase